MHQMLAKSGFRPIAAVVPSWPVILNQILNSAGNFLVTVALVRLLGLAEFGHFTIYFLVAQSTVAILAAAVIMPAVSIGASEADDTRRGLLSTAGALLLAGVVAASLLLAGFQVILTLSGIALQVLLLPFAALLATMAVNDLVRRLLLFERALTLVWLFDVLRYAAVAVVLFWSVGNQSSGTAGAAMIGLALAYAIALAGLVAMSAGGVLRAITFANFGAHARRLMKTGKWLSASAALQLVHDNIFLFVGSAVVGNEAVGIVRTGQTLIGVINPLFLALEHVFPRHIGHLANRDGWPAALHEYSRLAVAAGSGFLLLLLGLAALAGPLLSLVAGPDAAAHAWVMQGVCLAWVPYLVFTMITFALRAIERTRAIAVSLAASAIAAVAIAVPMVTGFGVAGMVAGMVIANTVTALALALQYTQIRRREFA